MRRSIAVGRAFKLKADIDEVAEPKRDTLGVRRSRRVAVGQDFEGTVSLTGDWAQSIDANTRSQLVWAALALGGILLLGAATYGLWLRDFSALQSVWGVAGPIYGTIVGYYFTHVKR